MSDKSPGINAIAELSKSRVKSLEEVSVGVSQGENQNGIQPFLHCNTSNTRRRNQPVARFSHRSDDECRLLGDYEQDPDAVPIKIPHNPPCQDTMAPGGIYQGGHRPMNTLGAYGNKIKSVAVAGYQGIKRSYYGAELELTSSSGDNVMPSGKAFDLHAERHEAHVRKKPRTLGNTFDVRPKDLSHAARVDGEDDIVMLDRRRVERIHPLERKTSYNSSLLSQDSEVISNSQSFRGRPAGGEVQEYRAVENLVKMSSKSRPRSKNMRQGTTTSRRTPSGMIDLSTDNQVMPIPKTQYQGTARETKGSSAVDALFQGRVPNGHRSRDGEIRSGHFANVKKPRLSSNMKAMDEMSNGCHIQQPNLNTKFVDDKGQRRNSLLAVSSDELQADIALGFFSEAPRKSPPHAPSGSRQPLEVIDIQPATPPRQVLGLPESNIRRTESTSSGRRSKRPLELVDARKESAQWGVELVTYRMGHTDLDQRTGCGLIYLEKRGAFIVQHEGKDLSEEISEFGIQLRRVLRVTMGTGENCRLRLHLSRSANSECHVDIEFRSHKDVCAFVDKLQRMVPGFKVESLPSDKMDRVFEKRILETDPQPASRTQSSTLRDEEVELILAKKKLKESKTGSTGSEQQMYGSRHPRGLIASEIAPGKLVERLRSTSIASDPSQNPGAYSSRLQQTIVKGKEREGGINTHQRPSGSQHETRSRTQQSVMDKTKPEKASPELSISVPERRFSKSHGLGALWSKPLVFPQAGKRKATVEWKDLTRLDEGEFLNDNLIGFYLRYLEYQLEQEHPELAKKIYFFNTYFFASLTRTAKGKKGINYEAVQNWTRTVDVFGYDYVVVPINESAHWYVALICNLPALDRNLEDGDEEAGVINTKTSSDPADDRSLLSTPGHSSLSNVPDERKQTVSDSDADSTRDSFAEMNLGEKEEHKTDADWHKIMLEACSDIGSSEVVPEEKENQEHRGSKTDVVETSAHSPMEVDQKIAANLSPEAEPSEYKKLSPATKANRRKSAPRLQKYAPKSPVIVTLDSLGLSHSPTVRALKDYLAEEGKSKRSLEYPDDAIRGMTAKGIPLQTNFCDCGLYLLGYLDKLIQDPQDLCYKILQRELDEGKDWPCLNPSQLRDQLRSQIQVLHAKQENERKETAKKSGKYISREQSKPTSSPARAVETPRAVNSGLPNESAEQGPKVTRESALKGAVPLEHDDGLPRRLKQPPVIEFALKEVKRKEITPESVPPRIAREEDSLEYLGVKPVMKESGRQPSIGEPTRMPNGKLEDLYQFPESSSSGRLADKPVVLSRNSTPGEGDLLGI